MASSIFSLLRFMSVINGTSVRHVSFYTSGEVAETFSSAFEEEINTEYESEGFKIDLWKKQVDSGAFKIEITSIL